MKSLAKLVGSFQKLPDKKKYIEVITAILSIPVLISVVMMNYLSIQDKAHTEREISEKVLQEQPPTVIIVKEKEAVIVPSGTPKPTEVTPTNSQCKKEIGPIAIRTPEEGSRITQNPLEIDISYEQGDFCSVVWSYRINDGPWSDFGDNNILIYNMPSGEKSLELRVKSLASSATHTLKVNFFYTNPQEVPSSTATPTLTPTPPDLIP